MVTSKERERIKVGIKVEAETTQKATVNPEASRMLICRPEITIGCVEEKTTGPWYEGYIWPIILSGIFPIVFGYAKSVG